MAKNISGNKGSHNQILDGVTMKIRKTIYEAKNLNIFFSCLMMCLMHLQQMKQPKVILSQFGVSMIIFDHWTDKLHTIAASHKESQKNRLAYFFQPDDIVIDNLLLVQLFLLFSQSKEMHYKQKTDNAKKKSANVVCQNELT